MGSQYHACPVCYVISIFIAGCFEVVYHLIRSVYTSWSFTVAALKQVLVTQLMAQDEGERLCRSAGSRLLRTTSLRTPVEHSSTRTPSRAQDYTSGDTGFYECPEDYGECLTKKLFCPEFIWRGGLSRCDMAGSTHAPTSRCPG